MLIDELKTFVTVVEMRNFTKAGEFLHVSQPTVSLHIKHLEAELKSTLLVRANKNIPDYTCREILYSRAKQLLHLAEQTKDEILWQHNRVGGILRISASYTIGESEVPKILNAIA